MSVQELFNVWRKRALTTLTGEVRSHAGPSAPSPQGSEKRVRRFEGNGEEALWLRRCIQLFREAVGYPVADTVPVPRTFHDKLDEMINTNRDFMRDAWEVEVVEAVSGKVRQVKQSQVEDETAHALTAEVVHEQEAEAEEEAVSPAAGSPGGP
jgi:hypothetical protein